MTHGKHAQEVDPWALPARWSWLQRCKNTCIYGLVRVVAGLLRAVPFVALGPVSQVLGLIAWAFARRERQRAAAQLSWALPHLGRAAVRRTVRAMFVHLARSLLEFGHLPRLLEQADGVHFSTQQRALVDAAMAEGRGVVAVTGHIGNWELLAQVCARAGYPVHAIAKPLYDPRMTAWVGRMRRVQGINVLWRGTTGSVKAILRVFRRGEMLALLMDQDTPVDGLFVPFFGRPAYTPTAAASLALRFDAPLLFFYTQRVAGRHVLHVERLQFDRTVARDIEIYRLTALLTHRIESAIRALPSQWVWLHARWKRQSPQLNGAPSH